MDDTGNAELNYCYNCMTHLDSGQIICPICGHDNTLHQNPESTLPEGTILAGKYLVGKILGQGGFGITYLGFDIALNTRVAIKEYFPAGVGIRSQHSIRVTSVASKDKADGFRRGCEEFQEEARRLAVISSPNIVKVRGYFRENGTAYIVMNYLEGNSLTMEVAASGGKMSWLRVTELFKPLILDLDKLHKAHLMHRDIKPDNLKIIKDGGTEHLVLLDFGAARSFVSAEVTGTYSAMVTHGYAPVEQYNPKSRQGPYTDVYALCATMYAAITGTLPPTATDRMTGEAEIKSFSEMGIDLPEHIEKAIFHGLEVRSADRPQSMRELYDELNGKSPVTGSVAAAAAAPVPVPAPSKEEKPEEERKPAVQPETKKKANRLLPVLLVVLLAAGFFIYRGMRKDDQSPEGIQTAVAGTSTQSALAAQFAQETQEALRTGQTGTAWSLTETAEQQQTRTQEAVEAGAAQAEQNSRLEQTEQAETEWALKTAETVWSEQTAAVLFTTQEAQLYLTQTRDAEPTSTPAPVTDERNIITLGHYEQDGDLTNGAEAVEWQVLAVEDGRALVISRYALDTKPYNEMNTSVTWKKSTLRSWLNGEFYDTAFSDEEKGRIQQIKIKNADNALYGTEGGNNTPDRIFLLSFDEANQYFVNDGARLCLPTAYAKNQGAWVYEKTGMTWWWLRSPGGDNSLAAGVTPLGDIYDYGSMVSYTSIAVRPAFWMDPEPGMDVTVSAETAAAVLTPEPALSLRSLWDLGEEAYNNGDYDKAMEYLLPAAEAGHVGAQWLLGSMYWEGIGVDQSYEESARWYQYSALQNDSYGQLWTGYLYENGYGVDQSYEEALKWYQLSADQGSESAREFLTKLLKNHPELETDVENTPVPQAGSAVTNFSAGDLITLGHYEQDGDLTNGAEAVEWQVLAVEDGRALVISRYALDTKPYNETAAGMTWETCTLRAWLNGEFYDSVFSSEEKGQILQVTVKNTDNPIWKTKGGNDTTDRIFLLSIDEARQYFAYSTARQCRHTTYAKNNEAYIDKSRGTARWWLRSPGSVDKEAAVIYPDGGVDVSGFNVNNTGVAVRPAFWLDPDMTNEIVSTETEAPQSTETPAPTEAPDPLFWVISDTLLRDSPSNSGAVVRSLLQGTVFTYTGESRNADGKTWVRIKTETGYQGWIDKAVSGQKSDDFLKAGDLITMGHYEQDGDLTNGAEAIEWQVLAVEYGRALVISKYGLVSKRYNENSVNVTWETCTLRTWLNEEFYDSAFSSVEKERIRQVTLKNADNAKKGTKGGKDTTDRIFLLSIDEAERYFSNDEARQCLPTAYAKNQGAWVNEIYGGPTFWWLRSPGKNLSYAAYVYSIGFVNDSGRSVYHNDTVVRPAFWLNL